MIVDTFLTKTIETRKNKVRNIDDSQSRSMSMMQIDKMTASAVLLSDLIAKRYNQMVFVYPSKTYEDFIISVRLCRIMGNSNTAAMKVCWFADRAMSFIDELLDRPLDVEYVELLQKLVEHADAGLFQHQPWSNVGVRCRFDNALKEAISPRYTPEQQAIRSLMTCCRSDMLYYRKVVVGCALATSVLRRSRNAIFDPRLNGMECVLADAIVEWLNGPDDLCNQAANEVMKAGLNAILYN